MSTAPAPTWFGQPKGLTILFLTNMWEQFSYFGMRALLVYYMTRELLIAQETSSFIYGLYTAFAYFTPIVGGTIADRWLGKKRAVIIGASVMAAGHFLMAFEPAFYLALATIALGNGLFLPTLPSQINDLYRAGDPRRPWAYNVYYVGVNIGGFLAPLICGILGEFYGWHWGFGAAGIGMLAGLAIYLAGAKYLPPEPPRAEPEVVRASRGSGRRDVILLLLAIGLAVTVFRGAYEQIGNTVAFWAGSGVDRAVAGLTIPMTWFMSLNPLLVMLMTPFLLARWKRKAEAEREHSPLQKMAIGALIVAAAYLLLALAAALAGDGQASWLWLAAFFVVFTLGELYILPNGLGLFARLAPPRFGATTVAAWYLAIFTGSLTAGLVGTLWSGMGPAPFFTMLAVIATAAAGFLILLDRPARRIVAGADDANSARPSADGPKEGDLAQSI
ncbi:peptide MFS transporter [Sphingosinicella sp. LHD-64]|uniref:peptide MFS transporter n=1 Tax=Sphingosinicella sp. LHD-64 TaxID=3072139 RepID=UPI00280DAA04|nr:peptide MFS transporter [Sphingosinicella sp. LHD-64]MDQ8756602.1 peptide MFS transporter [Sphingosinicella sp. LHD-64]